MSELATMAALAVLAVLAVFAGLSVLTKGYQQDILVGSHD